MNDTTIHYCHHHLIHNFVILSDPHRYPLLTTHAQMGDESLIRALFMLVIFYYYLNKMPVYKSFLWMVVTTDFEKITL